MPTCQILRPWDLEVGDFAMLSDGVIVDNHAKVVIGRMTVVSQRSYICAGTHDYESGSMPLIALPIEVGGDSWICAESFIGPGVKIGAGVVVGARSLVLRDLPSWHVCAGHPCRVVKPRIIKSI